MLSWNMIAGQIRRAAAPLGRHSRGSCIAFLTCLTILAAAVSPAGATTLSLKTRDTILSTATSATLSSNLILDNPGTDTLRVGVMLGPVVGWRSLKQSVDTLTIAPKSRRFYVVSLIKDLADNTPGFSELQVEVTDLRRSQPPLAQKTIFIKNILVSKFSVESVGSSDILVQKEKQVGFKVRLVNEGSMVSSFTVSYELFAWLQSDSVTVVLAPRRDTVVEFFCRIPSLLSQRIEGESIKVTATGDSVTKSLFYNVFRASHSARENVDFSKRSTINLESGLLARQDFNSFYGRVSGILKFDKARSLAFNYRTMDYSLSNTYQVNVFNIDYVAPKTRLYAGQVRRLNEFFTFGNEFSVRKSLTKSLEVEGWYMKALNTGAFQSYYGNSDQYGVSVDVTKSWMILQNTYLATVEQNQTQAMGIYKGALTVRPSKYATAGVEWGLGADSLGLLGSDRTNSLGYRYGANFRLNYKRLYTNILYRNHTDMYPGLYRGMQQRNADISLNVFKQVSIGTFYEKSEIKNNFFTDTLLLSNAVAVNMEKYGVSLGVSLNGFNARAGAGNYKDILRRDMPDYRYGELSLSAQNKSRSFEISLNSQSGLGNGSSDSLGTVWFNNSTATVNYRGVTAAGMFYLFPSVERAEDGTRVLRFTETMNVMAGFNRYFGKSVFGSLQYSLARFSVNNFYTHDLLFNFTYTGRTSGLNFALIGSLPLVMDRPDNAALLATRNYVRLTVTKRFQFGGNRKKSAHDMNVRLFNDDNGNGVRDRSEKVLKEQYVSINRRLFITDRRGQVMLKNADSGTYRVDLTKVKADAQMIPAGGYGQDVSLKSSRRVELGFRRGRMLYGTVEYKLDKYSEQKPNVAGLKIIVSDSGAVVAYAITNAAGEFAVSVPAGKYTVALNSSAFNEKFKPERISYDVDLLASDSAAVRFKIIQKVREIRVMNSASPTLSTVVDRKTEGAPVEKKSRTRATGKTSKAGSFEGKLGDRGAGQGKASESATAPPRVETRELKQNSAKTDSLRRTPSVPVRRAQTPAYVPIRYSR